ncbi:L-asparagine transporter-like permease [Paenibacillus phyllosphaerae]|uniref:L-asparagine transporter-like permease n=1 Tax=Paenibacillus phyllosphaerae TaxID=274593 RepID=A0A7W5FQE4_9BACL|nr:hypothetical protein [Paenibacillus phyllosphaerae]MBB3113395.1 L-asparagine transporter-like permease [Paenibacillus phyllosphaerae]
MAKDCDALKLFERKLKFRELPLPSLTLATMGISVSIVTALLLPGKIYAYITTAAGSMQMYNWGFIIVSALKVLQLKAKDKMFSTIGLALLLAAVIGVVLESNIWWGFFISLALSGIIAIVTLVMQKKIWNKEHAKKQA